jgi:hypothetical protein
MDATTAGNHFDQACASNGSPAIDGRYNDVLYLFGQLLFSLSGKGR